MLSEIESEMSETCFDRKLYIIEITLDIRIY